MGIGRSKSRARKANKRVEMLAAKPIQTHNGALNATQQQYQQAVQNWQAPSPHQQQAQATTAGLMANPFVNTSGLASQAGRQNAELGALRGFTTRSVTDGLQGSIDAATEDAVDNVTSNYALSGRLGSGAFAKMLGKGITQASAPIIMQSAQADAARQMQAAGALAGFGENAINRDVSIQDRLASYEDNAKQRQLQAASMSPMFQAMDAQRLSALRDAGAMEYQQARNAGLDRMSAHGIRFNAAQSAANAANQQLNDSWARPLGLVQTVGGLLPWGKNGQ